MPMHLYSADSAKSPFAVSSCSGMRKPRAHLIFTGKFSSNLLWQAAFCSSKVQSGHDVLKIACHCNLFLLLSEVIKISALHRACINTD